MSTNYTPNYNLCQWEAEDKVLRTEFNADNAKIDAAIQAVDRRVDGKASTASVSSLKSTVDSLSQHTTALTGKGNCQIYATSYVGNGKYGSGQPTSFTFSHKPMVVFVTGPDGYQGIFTRGSTKHYAGRFGGGGNYVNLIWGSKSVQWYSDQSASVQMNQSGWTYYVYALLQAD